MADELLKNQSINQWWIPDAIERQVYVNCLKLVFCLLDKVADTLSIRWVFSFLPYSASGAERGQFIQKTPVLLISDQAIVHTHD